MIDHIIALDEEPARLSVRNHLLVIKRTEGETTIPLAEIAVLVVSNPCVTFTHAVLSELAKAGAMMITCDTKHMPAAMLLPLESNFIQAERFARQAQASQPQRKRLWQSIVRAKIRAQARLLVELQGNDAGLGRLEISVRSGDPQNVEAEAARRYWPKLFNDPSFRRDRYLEDQNRLLNYGYMVLRAIVARAICAAGLHPSLGLHHHNRYDSFQLADDLIEPFRTIVDRKVTHYCIPYGTNAPLDKKAKAALLEPLLGRFPVKGWVEPSKIESRTLFDIAAATATSLAAVYCDERDTIFLPEL